MCTRRTPGCTQWMHGLCQQMPLPFGQIKIVQRQDRDIDPRHCPKLLDRGRFANALRPADRQHGYRARLGKVLLAPACYCWGKIGATQVFSAFRHLFLIHFPVTLGLFGARARSPARCPALRPQAFVFDA